MTQVSLSFKSFTLCQFIQDIPYTQEEEEEDQSGEDQGHDKDEGKEVNETRAKVKRAKEQSSEKRKGLQRNDSIRFDNG